MEPHARLTLAGLFLGLVSSSASAQNVGRVVAGRADASASQSADAGSLRPQDFGVGNLNVLPIPAASFLPTSSEEGWFYSPTGATNLGYLYATGGETRFVAGVSLPEGAVIDFLVLYYDDRDVNDSVRARLLRFIGWNDSNYAGSQLMSVQSPSVPSFGRGYGLSNLISHSVENSVLLGGGQYVILVECPASSGFRGVEILWERQLSPAPATATFADVPTSHLFFRAIEALADSGITSGCGNGNFCPDQAVTRGELAKFLAVALGLSFNNNVF